MILLRKGKRKKNELEARPAAAAAAASPDPDPALLASMKCSRPELQRKSAMCREVGALNSPSLSWLM